MSTDERYDYVLKQLISEAARLLDLKSYRSEIKSDINRKDGFLSVMTRIKLENDERTYNLIAKFAPTSLNFRNVLPISEAFSREIYFYETIVPIFKELQVNISNPFDAITRSYSYSKEEMYEAILFDDLIAQGYQMWDYMKPMNEEHISLVLKNYGKMHALSFAYKHRYPEEFVQKFKHLRKSAFQAAGGNVLERAVKQCEFAEKGFDSVIDKEIIEKLVDLKNNIIQFVYGIEDKDQKYFVLLHGDCWCNNMMFYYESPAKTSPTKMRLLDWQIINIGPPIFDVSYFFYANASPEMYEQNLEHYKTLYYDSLRNHLQALGVDPNDLYPRVVFEKQWKEYSRFGLIMGLLFVNPIKCKNEMTVHDELTEETFKDGFLNPMLPDMSEFHEAAKPFIRHFIRNGFI